MPRCPSQDWDRYEAAQEADAAAEIAWWQEHRDRVLRVACAILSNVHMPPEKAVPKEVVNFAAEVVAEITRRSEPA